MKKILIKILVTTIVVLFLFSCKEEQKFFQSPAMPMWEISKENTQKSYILGTIEYLPKDSAKLLFNSLIINAFDSAKVYITQIDIQNSDFIKTKGVLEISSGLTLIESMSDSDFQLLKSMKTSWNTSVNNSVPEPDSIRLKLLFYLQDVLNHNNQNSFYFDMFWSERAMPMGKTSRGLETYQDYYYSFDIVNLEEQIIFLKHIKDFERYTKSLRKEVETLYLQGKYEELQKLYPKKFPYLETHYKELISNKHSTWTDKLSQSMDTASTFVTLDVVHFFGKDNMMDKLLSKGYNVKRIN
jgi:uncharacterized protein YbaP (TraB family)